MFKDILFKLEYINSERIAFDADLVIEAWDLLKYEGDEYIYVSLTNMVTFIIAIENLFVEQMQTNHNVSKQKRRFGYFVNDRFFVESDNEVRSMHSHFYKFFANRNLAMEKRKEEMGNSPELSFRP